MTFSKAKDEYKSSRIFYIIEATLEYFIAILVQNAYLANVTKEIGMSDALTGILNSFVSLGCGFQIFAIFLANKRPVKRWVTLLHSLNQLFFAAMYFVPFFEFTKTAKVVLLIVFLLLGHVINNIVNSPKINWYMSLIDDKKRGRFTANKEIVSLISGMLFTFAVGAVIDHYKAAGDIRTAFIFSGVGILVLMALHTATLLSSKEKPVQKTQTLPTGKMLKDLFRDKTLFKIILVSVLWNVAHYAAIPFYGSYQRTELGFSMTFISVLSALYAVCRSLFSRPLGRFADKHSFSSMLNVCFVVVAVGFSVNAFTVPSNGKVLYTVYYMLYAIGMAGINSSEINLIYDYVAPEKRVVALALKSTLAGFAGFFTTLIVSPLVSYIQKNGNALFGLHVYAQQVCSALAVIGTLIALLYLNVVVKKIKDNRSKQPQTPNKEQGLEGEISQE